MTTPPATSGARSRVPQRERRAQLLDVTLRLLAEDGFDELSVEAIARRAGVNRVVVYRSFANLQVLLLALLRREQRRVERQLDAIIPAAPGDGHPREILLATLGAFLAAVEGDRLTWRVALVAPESAPVVLRRVVDRRRNALERRVRPLVAWGVARLAVGPETIDEEVLSRMLLSVGEEYARLLLEGGVFTRTRLVASAERLLGALAWRDGG